MSGIGTEVLCIVSGGLDMSGHEEADPRVVCAERVARGWLSERGSIWWQPERGLGLLLLQNADLSRGDLARIEVDARADARMEDGVTGARVSATTAGGTLRLMGAITMNSGLSFVLTVDSSGAAEVLS
jgi:hypothetical protein